jgi:hypothetical protein
MTVAVVLGLAIFGLISLDIPGVSNAEDQTLDTIEAVAQATCNVEDVSLRYNDRDDYLATTDPGAQAYIISGDVSAQALNDDGTLTVPTNAEITMLAGENSSTYFTELITANTLCSDPFDLDVELKNVGSATMTLVNDNGVTSNADATAEAMSADSAYTTEVSVRAPSKDCVSNDAGMVVAVEYDATYFSSFDSDLVDYDQAIYITHNSSGEGSQNSGLDQWKTFLYGGSLCDNEKLEFVIVAETTSTQPTEDTNPVIWLLPLDYDKNEDDLSPILSIYDEDNNLIAPSTVNVTYFVD